MNVSFFMQVRKNDVLQAVFEATKSFQVGIFGYSKMSTFCKFAKMMYYRRFLRRRKVLKLVFLETVNSKFC